jgi:hypothetical protein
MEIFLSTSIAIDKRYGSALVHCFSKMARRMFHGLAAEMLLWGISSKIRDRSNFTWKRIHISLQQRMMMRCNATKNFGCECEYVYVP